MTREDIGFLCNFQSIYNKKEGKIYFVGIIYWDKNGKIIPICDNMNFFSKKATNLTLRMSDLLSDNWSYGVPYEE